MITQEYLKECLSYDLETGRFTWLSRPEIHFKAPYAHRAWNTKHAGKDAGSDCAKLQTTYRHICIDDVAHQSHRLAWLYVYGEFPKQSIDHIDGDGSNNPIVNLRDVSHRDNQKNKRLYSNNISGVVGVSFRQSRQKWVAQINTPDGLKSLGRFASFEDAVAARKAGEIKYGYHKNHGQKRSR